MSEERWVPIPGYEGYEVSDLGRVRSWRARWAPRTSPLVLAPGVQRDGYLRVNLHTTRDGKPYQKPYSVHALVLLAFKGPRHEGLICRHIDGNQKNNALSNLAYGTHSENNLDAVAHGTHVMANRTHCPAGHPYDEANTAHTNGRRRCLACRRVYNRRSAERRRMRQLASR